MEIVKQEIGVTDLVRLLNQTLDYSFGYVLVYGEISNFRISKGAWIYFDLKDENCVVKFFGVASQINSNLEDGMLVRVYCYPKIHNKYGFSMQIEAIEPIGEGNIKKSAEILRKKLAKEGLFDQVRKRTIVYPPQNIGLITSEHSAAYNDFIKILGSRFRGLNIYLYDVQVQGQVASKQICKAIDNMNATTDINLDCIVFIRGGGSPEDLAAFNDEKMVRRIAGSKIPTVVGVGHEIDVSLAELAADLRASTPSNAAELLVPDASQLNITLAESVDNLSYIINTVISHQKELLNNFKSDLDNTIKIFLHTSKQRIENYDKLISAYNPDLPLKRGYSIVSINCSVVKNSSQLKLSDKVNIKLYKGSFDAQVIETRK